jgi:ribosomal protein L40E
MKRRRHSLAIARLVVRHVDAQPRPAARLLRSQLRCAAQEPTAATELGVAEQIDRARDEHLASLDADDGLAALCVAWEEVLDEVVGLLDANPTCCSRCGARLSRRGRICRRCRTPVTRSV